MGTKATQKIFLAETVDDLTGLLEQHRALKITPADLLVVALEPEVKVYCKENGWNYVDTLPFFNNDSHKQVLKKSHHLTTLIRENLSFAAEPPVNNLFIDSFIFYSRFYINNFLRAIEILKGIKNKYGNVRAYAYSKNQAPGQNARKAAKPNPFMTKGDRFVGSLTEKYFRANRLKILSYSGSPEPRREKSRSRAIENILRPLLRTLFIMKLKQLSRYHPVFATAPTYNLDRVCRDIQAQFHDVGAVSDLPGTLSPRGYLGLFLKELLKPVTGKAAGRQLAFVPVHLFNPGCPGDREKELQKIKQSYQKFASRCRREFVYEDCSFWDEFNRKVEADLLETLADMHETAAGQRTFLEYLKPKLVLSAASTAKSQSWARVSRSLGIPALVIPQKTLLVPADEYAGIEEYYIGRAQVNDIFVNAAAQSPLITKYLKWSGYKGNIIQTGNLVFARLDEGKRKEKRAAFLEQIGRGQDIKIILWAPSMKTRRSRRFFVIETIDELTSAMEEVFEIVSRMENIHLVFRIHPGDAITEEQIYKLLSVPDNVSVSSSGAFEDVLAAADLLLSFSSTAVQEALINFIPVLLYDRWNRYNHLNVAAAAGSIPSAMAAAYYIRKKEHLAHSIRRILERHAGKNVSRELFKDYVFTEDFSPGFFDFVGRCLDLDRKKESGGILEGR